MQPLTDRQLLDIYGRGRGRHPLDRALLVLAAALPECEVEQLADLPISKRDDALLALRAAIFGGQLVSYIDCVGCGERLEFELDIATLRGAAEPAQTPNVVQLGERRFRLPTSRDLSRIAESNDEHEASRRLASLCAADGTNGTELSDELITELEEAF